LLSQSIFAKNILAQGKWLGPPFTQKGKSRKLRVRTSGPPVKRGAKMGRGKKRPNAGKRFYSSAASFTR